MMKLFPALFGASVLLLLTAPARLLARSAAPDTAPYDYLDRVEGGWVNLNNVPVRPMLRTADAKLYTINNHDSTLEVFLGSNDPIAVYPMPWSPVAVAYWSGIYQAEVHPAQILVVCRGSACLARLNISTGEIYKMLELPAEPGDILVNEDLGEAYISCSGDDSVVVVNLRTNVIDKKYHQGNSPNFRIKHPLFLSFDPQKRILVSPLFSGNNSTSEHKGGPRFAGEAVLNLADGNVATTGLPDIDLLRIDRSNDTVSAVAKGTGTILFAHGVNPVSPNDFWQLNTEANNKNGAMQTEPQVKGKFVFNQLTITQLPSSGTATNHNIKNLDKLATGSIDPTKTVGQPYALAFRSNGYGYITGLLTDNVMIVDAGGNYVNEFDLPDGAIPRGILIDSAETAIFVYCWGLNQVRVYNISNFNLRKIYYLRYDPAPQDVKDGRAIFYDAGRSELNNMSCASCHVEGRTDMLSWNLSDGTKDDKGPLVTQTLAGIEKLVPFHWRGERANLKAFSVAFKGLLGGADFDPLSPEFAKFEAFVHSIQNPANPRQNKTRVIDKNIVENFLPPGTTGDAIHGQDLFQTLATVGSFACADCHSLPTGTSNDMFKVDIAINRPRRMQLKAAPYHEIWRKSQESVKPGIIAPQQDDTTRALLGSGLSHSGFMDNLQMFEDLITDGQNHIDISSFVFQIDQGIAPAAHKAYLLDSGTNAAVAPELQNYLMDQAGAKRNCDIVVFGKTYVPATGGVRDLRWYYSRAADRFVAEDSAEPQRTLADFIQKANVTFNERNTFVGLPVGMGERFGVDFDMDGILNLNETTAANVYIQNVNASDVTAPNFVGSPQASYLWKTARVARIYFQTNEPTTAEIHYSTPNDIDSTGAVVDHKAYDLNFSRDHSIVLNELLPSTKVIPDGPQANTPLNHSYSVQITIKDLKGNPRNLTSPLVFDSGYFIDDGLIPGGNTQGRNDHVVKKLTWQQATLTGSLFQGTVRASTIYKMGGPPAIAAPNRVIVASVLKNGVKVPVVPPAGEFIWDHIQIQPPTGGPVKMDDHVVGPFVVFYEYDGITDITYSFNLNGVSLSDEIIFNIEAVIEVPALQLGVFHTNLTTAPVAPDNRLTIPAVSSRAMGQWSFPDNPPAGRSLIKTFP